MANERDQGEPMDDEEILDKSWLKEMGWPEKYPPLQLDPIKFPPEIQTVIPMVEKWVIWEPLIRSVVFQEASSEELHEFVTAVKQVGFETIRRLGLEMIDDETRKKEGYLLLLMLGLAESAETRLRNEI